MTIQADILKVIEGIKHDFQQADQVLSGQIFYYWQVHGAEIVDARSLSGSGWHTADGASSEGPLVVAVVTADCLPIPMDSRDGRVMVALHGSWQGLVVDIVGAATAYLNAHGVTSVDIRVAIGPGIRACCYEVSAGFTEVLQVNHGRLWEDTAPPWSQHRPLPEQPPRFVSPEPRQAGQGVWLGLVVFCHQLFQAIGVGPAQIEASAVYTYCPNDVFTSHRRHQRPGEEKHQQYAWIACKP